MRWEDMEGDDSVRHCSECECKVYDLRGLEIDEIVRFVEIENGEVCAYAHTTRSGVVVNGKCTKGEETMIGRIGTLTELEKIDRRIQDAESRCMNLKKLRQLIATNSNEHS